MPYSCKQKKLRKEINVFNQQNVDRRNKKLHSEEFAKTIATCDWESGGPFGRAGHTTIVVMHRDNETRQCVRAFLTCKKRKIVSPPLVSNRGGHNEHGDKTVVAWLVKSVATRDSCRECPVRTLILRSDETDGRRRTLWTSRLS